MRKAEDREDEEDQERTSKRRRSRRGGAGAGEKEGEQEEEVRAFTPQAPPRIWVTSGWRSFTYATSCAAWFASFPVMAVARSTTEMRGGTSSVMRSRVIACPSTAASCVGISSPDEVAMDAAERERNGRNGRAREEGRGNTLAEPEMLMYSREHWGDM